VVIPARNEKFLAPTVHEILTKARGDVEVVVHLDGYWPDPPLPTDRRIKLIHRGRSRGMRAGINSAIEASTGEYIMKLDGHCMLDEAYDEKLKANCADNWVVIPRRFRLDADAWAIKKDGRAPIDCHFLSYPFENVNDVRCGMHGEEWRDRAARQKDILLSDEMSSQGSCWFTTRGWWKRGFGPLRVEDYGTFVQEFQEIGNETWGNGGEVKVNKGVFYAHLHKGKKHGRGYAISTRDHAKGHDYTIRHWMLDRAADTKKLVEKFWPVPSWPEDLDRVFFDAKQRLMK
jgi:glycosyltransferase involved in cell wall biosynthesis